MPPRKQELQNRECWKCAGVFFFCLWFLFFFCFLLFVFLFLCLSLFFQNHKNRLPERRVLNQMAKKQEGQRGNFLAPSSFLFFKWFFFLVFFFFEVVLPTPGPCSTRWQRSYKERVQSSSRPSISDDQGLTNTAC